MPPSDSAYAADLAGAIDQKRYATLVQSLGDSLNRPKDRFDKSDLIERSLEVYTGGRLRWVDEEGRDFYDTEADVDIEFKFEKQMMFTEKRKNPRDPSPKLYNSLGTNESNRLPNPAEYYVLGEKTAMALISHDTLVANECLTQQGDGIVANIDFDDLCFIFRPQDIDTLHSQDIAYKERKMDMQLEIIESI